ncbi:MAG: response regulator [Leptospiraceae bacterium]|nr:response regulator [Leptospiraceae bacterium]
MKKRIMSVGQCNADHQLIKNFLEKNFECDIVRIDSKEEALLELQRNNYDLVLVNRKLDIDYSDGILLIQTIKETETLKNIPVMLVSNYKEYQDEAVRLGAVYGFGKAELSKEETKEKIAKALNSSLRFT